MLCELQCGANRYETKGQCGLGILNVITHRFHVTNEEDFLLPCAMVFYGGCNLNCYYCQNPHLLEVDIAQLGQSLEEEIGRMARNTMNVIRAGCSTLHFCGGEPTLSPLLTIGLLKHLDCDIPVVMNTNLFLAENSLKNYSDFVDVWVTDFKFGDGDCGKEIAGVDNYLRVVERNHEVLVNSLKQECIIRHVVLPGHVECCTKGIVELFGERFDGKAILNLILCFNPSRRGENKILRRLDSEEIERVINYVGENELRSVMISRSYQDMTPFKWWEY